MRKRRDERGSVVKPESISFAIVVDLFELRLGAKAYEELGMC